MTALRRLAGLPTGRRAKWATLVAVAAILVLAGPLAGKVSEVEDNGPTSQLPRGADSTWVEKRLPAFEQDNIQPAAVVYTRDGGLNPGDRQAIAEDRDALRQYAAGGDVAQAEIASDGEAAVVTFGMDFSPEVGGFDMVPDVRERVDAGLPGGLEAHVTGPAAAMYDSVSVFDGLNTTILLASASVVAILLLLTYRSPVLWLLPMASIGVAAALSEAVVYLLGKHAGLPVDGGSGGIMPIMVFGVGTDYALLLVSRYREALHTYADRHLAIDRALRRAGPAIVASAATVVLGLCSLLLADVNSTRSLGAVCAVGVGCAAVSMLVVLPLALALTGRWVFWPFVPRVGDAAQVYTSPWRKVAGLVGRGPRRVWVGAAGVLTALAVASVGLDVGTTPAQSFRETPDSVAGQQVLSAHFPGGSSAPAQIVAEADAADEVASAARGSSGIASVSDPVRSAGGDMVLVRAVLQDAPESEGGRDAVHALRDNLDALEGADARVGGATAKDIDTAQSSMRDALVVIPVALALVLLVLCALLRAIVGPLVLLATVLLSYGAALGAGGLAMEAMGFDAVDIGLPLAAFVFLVALGVDYTIFLSSRAREEVTVHGHNAGVLRGLIATGGVITSAGLVLAATFSVLIPMPIVMMIGMGTVIAIGILLDTFVVRSLLVPGLALDLGPRFWSPSRLARANEPEGPTTREPQTTSG